MYLSLTICAILSLVFYQTSSYQGLNNKLQHVFAFCYLWLWKKNTGFMFGFKLDTKDAAKYGNKLLPEAKLRENPRKLKTDLNATDSVGFSGTSNYGEVLIVRLNRLHDRCSEVVVYLKLANGEEYQLPIQPGCRVYNTNGQTFSAAGLTFEVLEPLVRWRIYFNGQLRATSDVGNGNILPIKFSLIWKPMNNYVGFPHDFEANTIAKQIAKENGLQNMFNALSHLTKDNEWNEQFGEVHGTLKIDDREETTILLRGLKDRHHGVKNWNRINREISIKGVTENGTPFHLFETIRKSGQSILYGYVCAPCNTITRHVHQCSSNLAQIANENNFTVSFKAGDRNYKLTMEYDNNAYEVSCGENWEVRNNVRIFKMKLNGKRGYGIMETGIHCSGHNPSPRQRSLPQLIKPVIKTSKKLVVTFKDIVCQSSKFVGGKGSSLAMMTSLQNSTSRHHEFEVPQGVCVTNVAFGKHLEENPTIKQQLTALENVAWKRTEGNLQEECERTKDVVLVTNLSQTLRKQLEASLQEILGEEYENLKFAVRSSALGEDGEELSAAGQNETFLGITGIEEICRAIVKCWASQFSHRSIEYKRQNGQLLNAGMAIVVQQMVSADVAGVLFTNHPVTGSRAYMLISSNYGLGESVVSGSSDPDTILLKRTWDEQLTVMEKQIGKKNTKIIMSEGNGVEEESVGSDEASRCTVTDEVAIKLGKIAIYLEQCWGTARDIEWALRGDKIFLLQSRPVTTDAIMSEFEIVHEFDTPFQTDFEAYSTANIGEVLPGAQTPLSTTFLSNIVGATFSKILTWKYKRQRFDPTTNSALSSFYGHLFFNRIQEKLWSLTKQKDDMAKAYEIGMYGRVLDDDDHILRMALERADNPPWKAAFMLSSIMIRGILFGKWISESCRRKLSENKYREQTTIEEAYRQTGNCIDDYDKAFTAHVKVSFGSMLWNLIILNMLSQKGKELSNEEYADFAALTAGANNTESGEVPVSLKELAALIVEDIEPLKFSSMSVEDALKWITENVTKSQRKFQEFVDKYGHRGYKEFDVGSETWSTQPEKLIKLMQEMVTTPACYTNTVKKAEIDPFEQINTKLSPLKKKLMTYLLSAARSGVRQREMAKSYVIKVIDGQRKRFRNLARLMAAEGMLPDEGLLFFLTYKEIEQVLQTRSVKSIQRAKQRRRLHETMNALEFPELMAGFPKPVEKNTGNIEVDKMSEITGFPVCQGIVQGPARVIHSFHQVQTIRPGDILITHATDIGWSPYFPLLAGVVTELGGLVSHGAVVAREFGLPCIVGAVNATSVFKSGEIVLLDAKKGTLSRVTV